MQIRALKSQALRLGVTLTASLPAAAWAAPAASGGGMPQRDSLSWLDGLALLAYLGGVLGIGLFFSRREKTTDGFFRGGQSLPWWAVGLSIYATMLSSITFMALPAKSYVSDWTYLFANLGIVAVAPLVMFFYIPFYRRLNVTSAYEYLEKRFGLGPRLFASLSFMAFQVGRMAIVVYLPAVAFATVTSLDVYLCIVLTSAVCIAYTVIGGIEAVIWTDAVQTVVLLGGAVACLVAVYVAVPQGLSGLMIRAHEEGKFLEKADWFDSDLAVPSVLLVFVGSLFNHLMSYTASQDVVQRYVTTRDQAQAIRSLLTNALLVVPGSVTFFLLGTGLFLFYSEFPDRLDRSISADQIVPFFIVHELPTGIAGFVLAAILAAAQSTLSSSLNSVSAAWMVDVVQRFRPQRDDRTNLRGAKRVVLVAGIFSALVACLIASLELASMFDVFISVIGMTGGAISGLFILGIFTRRTGSRGALVGALSSLLIVLWVRLATDTHVFAYAMIGTLSCVVVGYAASWLLPARSSNLAGLTWRDRASDREPAHRP